VGLTIERRFSTAGSDPFDEVEWEARVAEIRDADGQVVFRQEDCAFPRGWSLLATNVVASRYFSTDTGAGGRENSIRQLIHRVTRTIADWGRDDGLFATEADAGRFHDELTWLCLHQYGAFNSPVWFNVGLYQQYGLRGESLSYHWDRTRQAVVPSTSAYEYPQASACFILAVADNMPSIMRLAASEAMVFKYGSGCGTDLSPLRARGEPLSGRGQATGPVSFMRIYDQVAAVVRSGGQRRRAAKMQSLNIQHPDIVEFITCKAREEQKARILIEHGFEADFNGEAYGTILYQNANLSVRVSDAFMQAVEHDESWDTRRITDSAVAQTYQARDLLRQIAECAHQCGDPGLQYDTTINRWHTCPNSGRINASNPCSEFMFLDDTACNLASLNLLRFRRPDGSFDVDQFRHAAHLFLIAQEILVDHASYPTGEVALNSHRFRPLGLGYANLGALLMSLGLPYDSPAARDMAAGLTALLTGQAYLTSAQLAACLGPFEGFAANREPMLQVLGQHAGAVQQIGPACQAALHAAAVDVWNQCLEQGRQHGFRNAQATVLAPTGTIAFLMDCDTTGVEPDIALVKFKQLAGRGVLRMVNNTVPLALETLGYDEPARTRILDHLHEHQRIEGAPGLKPEHLPVFDCAFRAPGSERFLSPQAHLKMLVAVQPFVSGAISKTINLPHDTTPEQIMDIYRDSWRLGLKAVAVYRDGSKSSQPVHTGRNDEHKTMKDESRTEPRSSFRKRRLPDTRRSITHKFDIQGHKGYVTVGLYEDGTPGEVFIIMAKEGSTIGGLMDAFGIAISVGLQYGVPLEDLVHKFVHTRFEPSGFTKNPDIPIAKSIVDYIFRWLGSQFVPGFRATAKANTNETLPSTDEQTSGTNPLLDLEHAPRRLSAQMAQFQSDAPACDFCGAITVRTGSCYRCQNCGNSLGCS
jgi:ribonucleoside-diphosphate reductase alpha chain